MCEIDVDKLEDWRTPFCIASAGVELVPARSSQCVSSMFKFGATYGIVKCMLEAMGLFKSS